MNIVPMIKCKDMIESISFYTNILDFKLAGSWDSFSILTREGAELHLSTHSGDGTFGTVFSVIVDDVDAIFRLASKKGLDASGKKESPVHQAPVEQTWGTKEFYADDPSGNTIRYVQRPKGND